MAKQKQHSQYNRECCHIQDADSGVIFKCGRRSHPHALLIESVIIVYFWLTDCVHVTLHQAATIYVMFLVFNNIKCR